jgi:SIR2-like domain
MPHYLLTGAGFSANWGGWVASEAFEYLLGTPEIMADPQLRDLLWSHQAAGGFEDALAELQRGYSNAYTQQWTEKHLIRFQGAVGRMFDDMNQGYMNRTDLEFSRADASRMVQRFLMRFDAIFTLNQDILLEHFYCSDKGVQSQVRPEIPGMRKTPHPEPIYSESLSRATWLPRPKSEFRISPGCQQYIKLHGSANWHADDGKRVMILGGAKQQEIGHIPILQWYLQQFEEHLVQPNARLMVIGYGFRDEHVNAVIDRAAARGLKMFVIDPRGARIAHEINQARKKGHIGADDTPLEQLLQRSLIGGSQRSLRAIFTDDETEHSKIMRFFSRP